VPAATHMPSLRYRQNCARMRFFIYCGLTMLQCVLNRFPLYAVVRHDGGQQTLYRRLWRRLFSFYPPTCAAPRVTLYYPQHIPWRDTYTGVYGLYRNLCGTDDGFLHYCWTPRFAHQLPVLRRFAGIRVGSS